MTQEQTSQMMTTSQISSSEHSGAESKYRFCEKIQAALADGLFWPSLFVLFLALSVLLLTSSSELCEAFRSLPVLDQLVLVVTGSAFCLGYAATVREFRNDWLERWAARIVGALGFGVITAFALWMAVSMDRMKSQVETLQHQIATRKVQNASGIALTDGGNADRDLLGDASITTRSGHVVSVSNRPMSTGIGRAGRAWDGVRYMDGGFQGATAGQTGSLLVLPGGVSAARSAERLSDF